MELYFIRHAQSTNNALWQATHSSDGRHPDPDLSEKGFEQARYLAAFLKSQITHPGSLTRAAAFHNRQGFGLTHLYCSLMRRAVRTAAAVAEALDLPLYGLEDLHENGGVYAEDPISKEAIGQPGCSRSDLLRLSPRLVLPATVTEAGWWNRPLESLEESKTRARRLWQWLLAKHGASEDRVALFSHGGFYHTLMSTILGIEDHQGFWFELNNAAISRIDVNEEGIRILYTNRTDYLPTDLIT